MKRKIISIFLALAISIVLLLTAVAPAMAAKPLEKNDNKPVAWVDSEINYAAPEHARHSLSAKLLADGSVVGHLNYGNGPDIGKGYEIEGFSMFTNSLVFPGIDPNLYSNFWYDEVNGAAMADIKVFIWMDVPGVYTGPLLYRYQIADYGEPGKKDWARHWYWLGDFSSGSWVPDFSGWFIPYLHGNAQVHLPNGNEDVTPEPADWNPSQVPPSE